MKQTLVANLLLTLACGGNETPPEAAEETAGAETLAEVAEAATDAWVIAPFTLTDSGGQVIGVDAEGQLRVEGTEGELPRFMRNGDVVADGETIIRMRDGVLRTPAGDELATIGVDGSATVGDAQVGFGPGGEVLGGNTDGPGVTLAPADSPAKRLAMTVLLMMTLGREMPEEPASAPAAGPVME